MMKYFCTMVLGVWLAAAPAFAAAPPTLKGVGVDETLAAEPVLAPALDSARVTAGDLPVFVRLLVTRAEIGGETPDFGRLDARLALYGGRHVPVLLVLADPPVDAPGIDAWRPAIRALAERCRGKVLGYQVGDRLEEGARPDAKEYAYLVKFVAVQVRSIDSAAIVVEGGLGAKGAADWQRQLYAEDVAAYLDAVAVSAPPSDQDREATEGAITSLDGLAAKDDPSAALGVTGLTLPADPKQAVERLMAWHLAHLGSRAAFTTCAANAEAMAAGLRAALSVKDVLNGEVVTLDERAAALKLTLNGQDVAATLPHRLLYNMTTFATYLLYWGPPSSAGGRLQVNLRLASSGTPALRDATEATTVRLRDVARDEAAKTSAAVVDVAVRPLLLDFNYGAEEVYALRSEASDKATPTVDEIVFRYQQNETAQEAVLRNYVANARISVHFQPTPLDSYDVVTENRFFSDRDGTEFEELSFSLNGSKFGRNHPPFPLLQPEKVLSLPLALKLNRDYVYHLDGVDRVGDRACYVVRFDPVDPTRSLYQGRVWIDSERYVRLKVQAIQTNLSPPVVSNEETQTFEPEATVDSRPIYLFTRLVSHQIMLLAGRNLLVERQVAFSDFQVNAANFAEERQEARRGDNYMYRDTDQGLRHYVKRGDERVVSENVQANAKAFAAGVTFDPSYDTPVPLVGIDYINFDFLNRGLQFGFIFSGVVAAGNLQKAQILGGKFDVSGDFYAVGYANNDLVFDQRGERIDQRLRSRFASTGVNFGYQMTEFQKVVASAHFQYDNYLSVDQTAPTFSVPASTVTGNYGLNYEYRRGGYSLLGAWSYYRRGNWPSWGDGTEYDPSTRTYTKYNVGVSKEFYFKTFHKFRVNAAYYGGQREDRFSMYRFGLFDETRMRGVPSAGARFSDLGMFRAQYSFNLFELYRLAVYLDQAVGRTPTDRTWRPISGTGFELNFKGPKTTMLKVGVGKGFLPQIYKGSGSWVIELMFFKPL